MNLEDIMRATVKMEEEKKRETKLLLNLEWVVGVFSLIILFGSVFVASFFEMETWIRLTVMGVGFVLCFVGLCFATKIEQVAGYYLCKRCKHKYIPAFSRVLFSMHIGRTRYMKCPECKKRSWQKKVKD